MLLAVGIAQLNEGLVYKYLLQGVLHSLHCVIGFLETKVFFSGLLNICHPSRAPIEIRPLHCEPLAVASLMYD